MSTTDAASVPGLSTASPRPYWQTTMPPLPDRSGRPLPDAADVVVVGGGYTGVAAARALAGQGASVVLLEAETLGFGASTRNGGIVHAGYSLGFDGLRRRFGEGPARALFRDTLEGYALLGQLIADEGIDAGFVEGGWLNLAWGPSHVEHLAAEAADLRTLGVPADVLAADAVRGQTDTRYYHGALAVDHGGGLHPGRFFAGLAEAAARAGADLHEHVRALSIRGQADGRSVLETSRGPIIAREVVVATNGYTDGVAPALRRRILPIGSYIIATEPLAPDLAHALAPTGRVFFDTKNFLYYWRVVDGRLLFGGRASFWPTTVARAAAMLYRGMLEVYPQLGGVRIEHAWGGRVGYTFDRLPHVGRIGGVTYAMGYCGTGVLLSTHLGTRVGEWLGGGPMPLLARVGFPLVPAPYEGRPWFLPLAGEWYRLRDRLERRSPRPPGRSPEPAP